jgi:hypothetical protein
MSDLFNAPLSEVDPLVSGAIDDEVRRQAEGLELIASENFVSEAPDARPPSELLRLQLQGRRVRRLARDRADRLRRA